MNLSEINWDFNAAGAWPLQIKAAAILLASALVAGGGVYQFTMPQLTELDQLEAKEQQLRTEFSTKQKKAVNVEDYRAQFKEIEALLGDMIKQMPTRAEVAELLDEISLTALASGLENTLFKPEGQVRKDFYVEVPYSISMIGKYEELGLFISGLASLPRIVTVHNVTLKTKGDGRMDMKATVKTYNEAVDESRSKSKRRKKGK